MRALEIIILGVMLAVFLAGSAAAETTTVRPGATPQWDVEAHQTAEGGLHCSYYQPGTMVRETRLRGQDEERALRFQQVEKWEPNQQVRAFEGEPVMREQPLRDVTVFGQPTGVPLIAEKWDLAQTPTRLPRLFAPPTAWGEEEGRGAMMEAPKRPPTYIAGAQQTETDFSRFELQEGCLYVRPEAPSALQQVNNRQFAPQWHF
jgi:hypothetical protein